MAANTKKSRGKGDNVLQQEDILQAVVLADSFNVKFAPITLERPRALLPLVNCPLIDYTLEFLASAGMQEVFVFCCAHADQLKKHLRASKWNHESSHCTVTPIVSEGCASVGDALREIERKSMIRSHFVLVSGDLVSNMQLKELIDQHKERFRADKSTAMTLVFKKAFPGHRTRSLEDEIVIATDSTQRILNYQKMHGKTKARFPLSLFEENCQMSLRYDLMHSHISICSPRVTELFVDNFDYQTMSDFIRGVLLNEEIEGNKLYVHVIEEEYAARVTNLPMYDSISKDVIRRWSHPMVPENLTAEGEGYKLGRHNVYLASDVTLERGSILQEDIIVGQGTTIGTNTFITHSVIGKNCQIGQSWARCYPPTRHTPYKIPPGHSVFDQDHNNIDHTMQPIGDVPVDAEVIGDGGEGYVWYAPQDEDEEEEVLRQQLLGLNISVEEEGASSSEDSEDEDEDRLTSISPPPDDTKLFYNEVVDSLQRTVDENVKVENLILEVNSSKYAYNVSMKELNQLVVKAIMEMPHLRAAVPLTAPQLLPALKKLLNKMLPLFKNYIKSAESQLDCLGALEEYCLTSNSTATVLPKILLLFYEADILGEDMILNWYNAPSVCTTDSEIITANRQQIRTQVKPFIKWLEEAEEESDSD